MLTANLLPPEEKKAVQLEEYRRLISFFGARAAGILMIGLILLTPSYIFLSMAQSNVSEQASAEAMLAEKLNLREAFSDAMQTGVLLKEARLFLDRRGYASQSVKTFFVRSGSVRVETLSIARGGDVAISGFAQTRDDLLLFQKQLQDSQMLESVSFPISDIIRSADIHFTMRGKLKAGQEL
ncbi:MAG: hypothetical protein HY617_04070 [Candidatus Sungbacteria bacterium]|nr:hypothetical protein [Candidatus Sungbacteria bacterium]